MSEALFRSPAWRYLHAIWEVTQRYMVSQRDFPVLPLPSWHYGKRCSHLLEISALSLSSIISAVTDWLRPCSAASSGMIFSW